MATLVLTIALLPDRTPPSLRGLLPGGSAAYNQLRQRHNIQATSGAVS